MINEPTYDARAIANLLLAKGEEEGIPIDPMKLLKLTYIAHGWVLGLTEQPLITQPVLAWPYGPVISDVYNAFRNFGSNPITTPAMMAKGLRWMPYEAELPMHFQEIIKDVWDEYKDFTGLQLSTLTHRNGTPWAEVTKGKLPSQIRDIPIPNELIQSYYQELSAKNSVVV